MFVALNRCNTIKTRMPKMCNTYAPRGRVGGCLGRRRTTGTSGIPRIYTKHEHLRLSEAAEPREKKYGISSKTSAPVAHTGLTKIKPMVKKLHSSTRTVFG